MSGDPSLGADAINAAMWRARERAWPIEWTNGECRMIIQIEEAHPGVFSPEIMTEVTRQIALLETADNGPVVPDLTLQFFHYFMALSEPRRRQPGRYHQDRDAGGYP